MIWLTWRQLRASAAAAAAALALLATVFALTRPGLTDELSDGIAACSTQTSAAGAQGGPAPDTACMLFGQEFFHAHKSQFLAVTALVLILPGLVGLFWGAPLITRELETGTHRLVWNQSITRTRWLVVKLGLVGLAAMTAVSLGSLAVTWWASPIDRAATLDYSRMEPLLFAARGLVPVGYAAFAFALGVSVGLLVRRTLPAMAITLAAFFAVQLAMPVLVRPHVLSPVRTTMEISDENPEEFQVIRVGPDRLSISAGGTGAWILDSHTIDASGRTVDAMEGLDPSGECLQPRSPDRSICFGEMTELGYRQQVTYQPDSRFWPIQWIETGIYLALALGLTGFCFWRIRRDLV